MAAHPRGDSINEKLKIGALLLFSDLIHSVHDIERDQRIADRKILSSLIQV